MKQIPLLYLLFSAGWLLWGGCATETKRSSVPAPAPAASTVPRPIARENFGELALRPSAPFEGEGWQPMFDGISLAGWRETQFAGRGDVECRSGLIVLNMGDPFT